MNIRTIIAGIFLAVAAGAMPAGQRNNKMLEKLIGKWKGTCKTWFEPDKLADESEVSGEFVKVLGGPFIRHQYIGKIQGKPRSGEDLLVYNSVAKVFESSWVDDFHMNYAILFSQGKETANGFSVLGHYDVGEKDPKWGWRTEFSLLDDDSLAITAYNATPGGEEAKAVELAYKRVK